MRDSGIPPASTTGRARGRIGDAEIFVGDRVMIQAEVIRSVAGVGALVRLTSKTDDFQGWIREDDLCWPLVDGDLPPEPPDGTWRLTHDSDGVTQIFNRDDAEGHNDVGTRRFDRHWWDVVRQEWIDWPTAATRGAAAPGVQEMIVKGGEQ